MDSGSIFHFPHHCRIADFTRFISISHNNRPIFTKCSEVTDTDKVMKIHNILGEISQTTRCRSGLIGQSGLESWITFAWNFGIDRGLHSLSTFLFIIINFSDHNKTAIEDLTAIACTVSDLRHDVFLTRNMWVPDCWSFQMITWRGSNSPTPDQEDPDHTTVPNICVHCVSIRVCGKSKTGSDSVSTIRPVQKFDICRL